MLLFITIIILIILNIYFIFKLYLHDTKSSLQLVSNREQLKLNLYKSNPVLINIPKNNIDIEIFKDIQTSYKNKIYFNNYNLHNYINFDEILLNSKILCNHQYSLSYYDDKQIISLKECNNNYHIISSIAGEEYYIYLFHPKYKNIKDNKELLEYADKILIKPYDILIIPFGWRYLQEINNKTITYHIDIDDYFTFIHNTILNKI